MGSYTFTTLPFNDAYGIDDNGDIVGALLNTSSGTYAIVDSGGAVTQLANPFGYPAAANVAATGINDSGTVVGNYSLLIQDPGFVYQSAIYSNLSDGGALVDEANGINSAGDIVGEFVGAGYVAIPDGAGSYTFQTINPAAYFNNTSSLASSVAYGINDAGTIVGAYLPGTGSPEGFIATPDAPGDYSSASYSVLNDPTPNEGTYALGINNVGQVVGYYDDDLGFSHGFLYSIATGTYTTIDDTTDPNSIATTVSGINDSGEIVGWYQDADATTHAFSATVACYCPGTLIATPGGEVAIENLAIGDVVRTAAGAARSIRWIGRRSFAPRFARRNRDVWPVLIRAGALAEQVPARDLYVSPLHAMFLDGLLIPAIALVNDASIVQPEVAGPVEYIHLELATHDVILAEGAASETFVDDDSRGMFHNAADYAARYPRAARRRAEYCAPRVTEGFALAAIRRRIAVRALLCADPAPAPLRGFVDDTRGDLVEGWAQNPDRPEAPVCLEIVLDGVTLCQTLANRFRADLSAAGLGSGRHAFSVRLPRPLAPERMRRLEVRRASDAAALPRHVAARQAA